MSLLKSDPARNGILLVNKRKDCTSFDVLRDLKKEFPKNTALGHAGTLDPFATGLLLVLVGKATKLSPFLLSSRKTYRAQLRFGIATDTGDLTGKTLVTAEVPSLTLDELKSKLLSFCEAYHLQIPPMYSAKKQDGTKLYELARKGIEVERKAVPVSVSSPVVLSWNSPHLEFEVTCTAGTYVRTLAEDFAKSVGTVAHLVELHRTSSGRFSVEAASQFIEFDQVFEKTSGVEVDRQTAQAIFNGKSLTLVPPANSKDWFPVFCDNTLIAVWDQVAQRSLRVFSH